MNSHRTPPLRRLAPFSILALLGAVASAQGTISPLVLDGDVVPGVGGVTRIQNLAVNASGQWIVEADTDHANTNADEVLLKDGALFLREWQPLSAPAGASINSFDAVTLSATGRSGWNFFLTGTSSSSDDSGIFYDDVLVIQESDLSTAAGFSPGTPYVGFFETKVNASHQILVMASVDDPAIATSVDRAMVLVQVDSGGGLISETVLYKEGDLLPGQTETLSDFGTGPHGFDFNEAGQVLFLADLTGPSNKDGCVYLGATLLAQEEGPSPVPGRNWLNLSTSQRVALGENGDSAYTGLLDGTTHDNAVIIRNNALFRQEGQTLPVFAPFRLTGFGTGPVDVDASGNVLWFGDWDDPDTSKDTGLFVNNTLLVQEGVTQIGGQVVESLAGVQDGYALSPDGRYVIFEATLAGGVDGAFLIDFQGCPVASTYCTAKPPSIPACEPLFSASGAPSASAPSGFTIEFGPVPGGNLGIFLYTTSGPLAAPIQNAYGWFCLTPGPGLFRLPPSTSGGTSGACDGVYAMDFNTWFATQTIDPNLVAGAQVDLQTWYRDPPNPGFANLSDALQFLMCP